MCATNHRAILWKKAPGENLKQQLAIFLQCTHKKLFCRGRVGSFDQLGEQYFAVFAIERLYGAGE